LDTILPSYYERRKSVKNVKAIKLWNKRINELLKLYDAKNDKYSFELLIAVLQIVENNLIYKKNVEKIKNRLL